MVVGLAVRVAIAVIAPALGGEPLMKWLATSPLGLATGAVLIQCALLVMAQLRSTLMPELRTSLVSAMRSRPSRSLAAVGLVVGIAPLANLCGMLVAKLTGANLESIEFVGALVRKASGFELVVMCTALTLMPAVVEETLFRGLVLGTLDELRPALAVGVSALAFGAFHLDVAQGVATAVLGLGFGFVVQTTGSLLGAMVAHATYNLLVLLSHRFIPITTTPEAYQLVELWVGLSVAATSTAYLWRTRVRPDGMTTERVP
jgi:membrane protease YdiL (CAAX protease family)